MGRTAIVLSGGGAKGAFQLGALDFLIRDHGVDPEILVGVSTGTLNAAMLAQGRGRQGLLEQLDELTSVWFSITANDDIYYARFGGVVGLLLKADSVYSNKPLWTKIQDHVDPEKLVTSGRVLRVGVVELMSGRFMAIDGSELSILEMIRASAAIPVLFNPVDVGKGRFVDGGVRDITPLGAAFDALAELAEDDEDQPDTIYVVLASPLTPEPIARRADMDSGIEIFRRSIDLLTNEVYRNDLKVTTTINEAVRYHQRLVARAAAAGFGLADDFPFANHRTANLILIEPEVEHIGSLEFNRTKIRRAFRAGRVNAAEAVAAAAEGSNVTAESFEKPD